jgi:predicted dehydrogenase
VLCEKPLALTVADAEVMQAACDAAGVRFGVALMMRFHAQHRAALELVQHGRLGTPVFARAQLSCWYPPIDGAWRQVAERGGGGALVDMGSHCIDLLEMFFGRVQALSAVTRRIVHAYPVEDGAVVTLQFANGALGVVDTFFCVPDEGCRNALELYGADGSILATGTIGQGERGQMTAYFRPGAAGYDAQQARASEHGLAIEPPPVNMYRAEVEEFSQAILECREPANDGRLGIRNQRLLAAAYESARTGCTVRLN